MANTYVPGQVILVQDIVGPQVNLAPSPAGDLTASATAVQLAKVIGPGSGQFTILIDQEQMTVTAGNGTLTLTVTRGVNTTIAAAHTGGATVTALTDDATDAVTIYKGDGTTLTPAPTVAHPQVGIYTAQITLDSTPGWWEYYWKSTGAAIGASRGRFFVAAVP